MSIFTLKLRYIATKPRHNNPHLLMSVLTLFCETQHYDRNVLTTAVTLSIKTRNKLLL